MYAIIEASGGQLKVTEGMELNIDLLDGGEAKPGKSIRFDKVLLIGGEGQATKVGTPYITGAAVTAEVVDPLVKGEKLRIQYFQPKKGSRQRTGHRQKYTAVKITGIKG